ncbi:MAG: DNA-(apurinic or apyrimidinic site) lyase / Formamidopyrimidine-DNA glycosylase [Cyanobacteria bacterium RYN_339]|nr:DNA-(apurinic or apyrimidinic site) lyase / Formamidopyrimidine-DNA glycosylase [Cyanobacteria bacterium RYN_339]
MVPWKPRRANNRAGRSPIGTGARAERVAKYLMLRLDDGRYWVVHLSLEGRFFHQKRGTALRPGTLLVAVLDDSHQLVLRDDISYTKTYLLAPEDVGDVLKLHEFGPEPISRHFSEALLRERLAGRRGKLKPLLLNQRILAGVGNIYADEALWRAKLHPERKANALSDADWHALYRALVDVLTEGIANRGTTAPRGRYRDLFGRKGRHQEALSVFRRAGEPCPRCGSAIAQSLVGSRPTFVCPHCQQEAAT